MPVKGCRGMLRTSARTKCAQSLPIALRLLHPIVHRLDLWLYVILVQIEGEHDRIEPWPELALQLYGEHTVTGVRRCPGVYDGPVSMYDDVATDGQLRTLIRRSETSQWLPDNVIGTLELLDSFHLSMDLEPLRMRCNL